MDYTVIKRQHEAVWPDSYYENTDPKIRLQLLQEHMAQEASKEDEIRLALFEHRYFNDKGVCDGVDRYLKCWCEMENILARKHGLFSKKSYLRDRQRLMDTFMVEACAQNREYEDLWLQEYIHFCSFYIEISSTDKSFTGVMFNLGRISDEQLALKFSQELKKHTIELPELLDLREEFALLAKAARESYAFYFPGREM